MQLAFVWYQVEAVLAVCDAMLQTQAKGLCCTCTDGNLPKQAVNQTVADMRTPPSL